MSAHTAADGQQAARIKQLPLSAVRSSPFMLRVLPIPPDSASLSPLRSKRSASRRVRCFELKDITPAYGLPMEKYSAVLLTDRQYQAHILDNEFRLFAEKLKSCAQLLEVNTMQTQPKALLGLLGLEEQQDFNSKIERAIAGIEEVVALIGKQVLNEPDAYQDNVRLLLAAAATFSRLFGEYSRLARSDHYQPFSLPECLVLIKRLSQIRLTLSYIVEGVSAHEEAVKYNVNSRQRRLLKSMCGFSSLGGGLSEKLKLFKDAGMEVRPKPVQKSSLSTKEFALLLIEQKNRSRSPSPPRLDTERADRRGLLHTDRYSNVSHLFLESQLKKGAHMLHPTSKFRKLRRSRATCVLERAANSSNAQVANSVRLLMAARGKSPFE